MGSLSIKGRLNLLVGLIVCVYSLVGIIGVFGMMKIHYNEDRLNQIAVNNQRADRLVSEIQELRVQLREVLVSWENPEAVSTAITKLKETEINVDQLITILDQELFTPNTKEIMDDIFVLHNHLIKERQDFFAMTEEGDFAGLQAWLTKNLADALRFEELGVQLSDLGIIEMEDTVVADALFANMLIITVVILIIIAAISSVLVGGAISRGIAVPLKEMADTAKGLAEGNVLTAITVNNNDEIGMLAKSFMQMADTIQKQTQLVEMLSKGDYTVSIPIRSEQDTMNQALNDMVEQSNKMIGNIKSSSKEIAFGSSQIAAVAEDLASGASQQSASVEEFSVALNQVLEQTQSNTKNADEMLSVNDEVSKRMEESSGYMQLVLQSMQEIDKSAKSVAVIIKVIEDIAYQTNILSLNAAVESARAGQYGKGFAVVADEVRNLANKSSQAARETAALIQNCLQRVQDGNENVNKTSNSILSVSNYLNISQEYAKGIVESAAQQLANIREINQGIEQISEIVQENSVTSETAAATALELSSQADLLFEVVQQFKTR